MLFSLMSHWQVISAAIYKFCSVILKKNKNITREIIHPKINTRDLNINCVSDHLLGQYIFDMECKLSIVVKFDATIGENLSDFESESVLANARSSHF